jgi:hypothetical protein
VSAGVHCSFYLRTDAGGGQYHYTRFSIPGYINDGGLLTENVPLVGDLVGLNDQYDDRNGQYRVIERSWGHNQYGSVNWPVTSMQAEQPDMLTIIVVEDDGPFRNEANTGEEER